jgi:hypothetical protein
VNGLVELVFWQPVSARPARNAPASPNTGFLTMILSPEWNRSFRARIRCVARRGPAFLAGRAAACETT